MNNNRGNNRRRGRGNNRQQGGQQINRIDSRARGNAPQLLEKYRKLAHDAHLNGDRVTEEYYLQFADHYFRVIADQRQRQEESRQPRRDDRGQDYADDFESEYESSPYGTRPPRIEQETREPEEFENESESEEANVQSGEPERDRGRMMYEPPANPFVRDNRVNKPRKGRRRDSEGRDSEDGRQDSPEGDGNRFDPQSLPPSLLTKSDDDGAFQEEATVEAGSPRVDSEASAEKPRGRRRAKPKPEAAGGSDDSLESIG